MNKVIEVFNLAKDTNLTYLKRNYDLSRGFFVAFITASIIQLFNFIRSIFTLNLLYIALDFILLSILIFAVIISIKRLTINRLALEIKESNLYKSKQKACEYIAEELMRI